MNIIIYFVDFFIHLDKYLPLIIQSFGIWAYVILFLVIFCETGLVVTPILPGDSLLFALGAFAAQGALNIEILLISLCIAAITGDTVNYSIGHFIGPKVFRFENSRLFKKEYLMRTHQFYEKHGGKAIIIAQFMPIIRTFAPFVAGVGAMTYSKFILFNVTGCITWVCLFLLGGYFFGSIPAVKNNFTLVIIAIVIVSVMPGFVEYWRQRRRISGKRVKREDMRRKFISVIILGTPIFLLAVPVHAKNIIKIGKDINIGEDQKVDNAFAVAGQITVSGLVENNVVTLGSSIVLTRGAVVRGNVICIGGVVVQGNGAQIYGDITEVNSSNIFTALSSSFHGDADAWSWLVDIIYFCFFVMLLTLALLTAVLFPRPLNAIIDSIKGNKLKSFFFGALGTLMIALFFILLVFSFVGIPLIPLAFSVILLAFIFGFISVSALLGKFILTKTFHYYKQSLIRETLLGLILWWLIGCLPFYIGMVIKSVVITMGFGGVLRVLFYRGYHWSPPVAGNNIESTAV